MTKRKEYAVFVDSWQIHRKPHWGSDSYHEAFCDVVTVINVTPTPHYLQCRRRSPVFRGDIPLKRGSMIVIRNTGVAFKKGYTYWEVVTNE